MAVVACDSLESLRDEIESVMVRVLGSALARFRGEVRSDLQDEVEALLKLAKRRHEHGSSDEAVAEKVEQKDMASPKAISARSMSTTDLTDDYLQELILDMEVGESGSSPLPGEVEHPVTVKPEDSEPPSTPIPSAAEDDRPEEKGRERHVMTVMVPVKRQCVRDMPAASEAAMRRAHNQTAQAERTSEKGPLFESEQQRMSGIVPQQSCDDTSSVGTGRRISRTLANGTFGGSAENAPMRRNAKHQSWKAIGPRSFVPAGFRDSMESGSSSTSPTETQVDLHLARFRQMRQMVQVFVESTIFDFLSAMLIILNSVTIGAQTAHMASNDLTEVPSEYSVLERLFCALFSIELAVRLVAYGLPLFDGRTGPGRWALFDGVVVGLQLFELAADSILGGSATDNKNMSFMRVMRILRLVRVLRIVRIIRFLGELRTIVSSVMNSMRALFWTFVLLMLGIYVVGIYFTQLVLDYRLSEDQLDVDERLLTYFGDLPRAILSLYQAMSGGVDWGDVSGPLIDHISPMQGIIFVIYIAFTVLALMNVVTGVFVEGSLRRAKAEEQTLIVAQLRSMFREVDVDQSGRLSVAEFQALLAKSEMIEYMKEIDVDIDEAQALFVILDHDQSGQIDYNEFVFGALRLRGAARAFDVMLLSHDNRQAVFNLMRRFDRIESKCEQIIDSCMGAGR